MSLKIKAIAGVAVAAALSAGVVASAAVAEQKSIEFRDNDNQKFQAAVELYESPDCWKAFEEALLEGKTPTDPIRAVYRPECAVKDDDEVLPVFLDPVSVQGTETELTLKHDASVGGYNLWEARIVTEDADSFARTFANPDTMDCAVHTGASGTLLQSNSYRVNLKRLSGKFTYLENGKAVTKYDFVDGYGTLPTLNYNYPGTGELVEKTLYFYVYEGNEGAPIRDVVLIHVVNRDYAKSAEYAALPYGDLIDCYTYVEPSDPSVAVPERN